MACPLPSSGGVRPTCGRVRPKSGCCAGVWVESMSGRSESPARGMQRGSLGASGRRCAKCVANRAVAAISLSAGLVPSDAVAHAPPSSLPASRLQKCPGFGANQRGKCRASLGCRELLDTDDKYEGEAHDKDKDNNTKTIEDKLRVSLKRSRLGPRLGQPRSQLYAARPSGEAGNNYVVDAGPELVGPRFGPSQIWPSSADAARHLVEVGLTSACVRPDARRHRPQSSRLGADSGRNPPANHALLREVGDVGS